MTSPPSAFESGYRDVDGADDPTRYIERLDRVGSLGFWQGMRSQMAALLDPRAGQQVLDLGCGTGDATCQIAEMLGNDGMAVGVDRSSKLVSVARFRSAQSSCTTRFAVGDVCRLSFRDSTFHHCRAERLLQHLDDPATAVAEAFRVLRHRGRFAVVEPDYGTLRISGADAETTERIVRVRRDHFASGRVGSQLPILMHQHGFREVCVRPTLLASSEFGVDLPALLKHTSRATAAGAITEQEGKVWVEQLSAAAKEDSYRQALLVVLVVGVKP